MVKTKDGSGALFMGGLVAILASTCCLGPLILLSLGISGAWISNLTRLEPYRPIFLGLALLLLSVAWQSIYRKTTCLPGDVCAQPRNKRVYKIIFWIVVVLVLIAIVFPYLAPLFY